MLVDEEEKGCDPSATGLALTSHQNTAGTSGNLLTPQIDDPRRTQSITGATSNKRKSTTDKGKTPTCARYSKQHRLTNHDEPTINENSDHVTLPDSTTTLDAEKWNQINPASLEVIHKVMTEGLAEQKFQMTLTLVNSGLVNTNPALHKEPKCNQTNKPTATYPTALASLPPTSRPTAFCSALDMTNLTFRTHAASKTPAQYGILLKFKQTRGSTKSCRSNALPVLRLTPLQVAKQILDEAKTPFSPKNSQPLSVFLVFQSNRPHDEAFKCLRGAQIFGREVSICFRISEVQICFKIFCS